MTIQLGYSDCIVLFVDYLIYMISLPVVQVVRRVRGRRARDPGLGGLEPSVVDSGVARCWRHRLHFYLSSEVPFTLAHQYRAGSCDYGALVQVTSCHVVRHVFFSLRTAPPLPFVSRTSPLLPLASLPTEENLSSGAAFLADRGRCLAGSTKRLSRRRRRSVRPTGRPGVQPWVWVLPRGRDDGAKITSARRGARGMFPCSVGGLNPSLAELPGCAVEVGEEHGRRWHPLGVLCWHTVGVSPSLCR